MSSLGFSVSVKLSGEQGAWCNYNGMLRKASQSACPYGKQQQYKILCTFLCGQKESETSSVMLCFPTILPTNRLNPHNPNWYPVKLLNSKKPSNPLQHKKLEDLYWHEWARHKSIHGFLVRMRSAVQIRPAAPKSIENFGFRCFFVVKRWKKCGSKCGSTAWPTPWPTRGNARKGWKRSGRILRPLLFF